MKVKIHFGDGIIADFCVVGKLIEITSDHVLILGSLTNKVCHYDFSDKYFQKLEICR